MAKRVTKRTGLRYLGGGHFPGLPARDLGPDDLITYAAEISLIEEAGTLATLYEDVTAPVAPVEESSNA